MPRQRIRFSPVPQQLQRGLVPINGSNWLITPNEPADPWDCNRYPRSLYCGGNPFSLAPVGFGVEPIINNCYVGIEIEPILGFYRLPPVQIARIFPECRKPKNPKPLPDNTPVTHFPSSCKGTGDVIMVIGVKKVESYYDSGYHPDVYSLPGGAGGNPSGYIGTNTFTSKLENIIFPGINIDSLGEKSIISVTGTGYNSYYYDFNYRKYSRKVNPDTSIESGTSPTTPRFTTVHLTRRSPSFFRTGANISIKNYVVIRDSTTAFNAIYVLRGSLEAIKYYFGQGSHYFNEAAGGGSGIEGYSTFHKATTEYEVLFSDCPKYAVNPTPPPEKRKRKCCEMSCCPQPRNPDNDALLRKILKKVEEIDKKTGIFPFNLPSSLISKDKGFLGNLLPSGTVEIKSHVDMWEQWIKYFDEIVGQFEIPIEIKDSDPLKPGDQPVGIKIPNIAEGIAEMLGLLLQISANSETANALLIKNLIEAGSAKQQGFTTFSYTKAIADYLDFKREEKTAPMQLAFTPNSDSLEAFNKESKVQTDVIEVHDKEQDFSVSLAKLLRSAALLEAVYLKRFKKDSDIGRELVKLIKEKSQAYTDINKKNNEKDDTNWNQFLENVENGYINTAGISDSTNPYGESFEERPRIRELGIEKTDAD